MPNLLTAEQRREQLLEMIRQTGFSSLPKLAKAIGASQATVRRDLNLLETTGAVRRTHGGVLYAGASAVIPQLDGNGADNAWDASLWERKRLIAKLTASLVQDGDTILFDGGTTTLAVAQQLVNRPIQVVTNSVPVASLFVESPKTRLLMIGGCVQHHTGVALGSDAIEMLGKIAVRRTIMSAAAINEEGFFNSDRLLVETEHAMLRAAEEVIIVADSSKFGRREVAMVAALGAVQKVVVDDQISPDWVARLESAGVQVLIARPEDATR